MAFRDFCRKTFPGEFNDLLTIVFDEIGLADATATAKREGKTTTLFLSATDTEGTNVTATVTIKEN